MAFNGPVGPGKHMEQPQNRILELLGDDDGKKFEEGLKRAIPDYSNAEKKKHGEKVAEIEVHLLGIVRDIFYQQWFITLWKKGEIGSAEGLEKLKDALLDLSLRREFDEIRVDTTIAVEDEIEQRPLSDDQKLQRKMFVESQSTGAVVEAVERLQRQWAHDAADGDLDQEDLGISDEAAQRVYALIGGW